MFVRAVIFLQFFLLHFSFGLRAQLVFEQKHDVPIEKGGVLLEFPWVGGLNSSQYNRADLDGDGIHELILYDRSGDVFQVFSIVNGSYRPANELCALLPDIPAGWVLFVDYDGDGNEDIFSNGPRGIVVFRNISGAGEMADWQIVADPLLTTGFSGKINLIANAADVPAIADIDSDGDLDILVYNFAIGGYIRYNKNLSVEMFGTSDSLEYEINTRTWGEFAECDCNLFAFNGETCEDISNGRVMHAGGKSLLVYDDDGDGDMDLLVGHEQCEELYFYENMGDRDSAYMTGYSNLFPDDVNPANFHIFPSGFLQDLDFDGVKDLVVTPGFDNNVGFKIDFSNSNWYYPNKGSNDNPEFDYQQKNFLQDIMLDLGENTVPAFADVNADGRIDLLVSVNGFWNGEFFSGRIVVFENTGSAGEPVFELTDGDYLGLSSLMLINPKISLVDFDSDGVQDLTYSGFTYSNTVVSWLMINLAAMGEPYSFDSNQRTTIVLPKNMTGNDNPTFFDVDEDGLVDLLLGKSDGALEFHRNRGDQSFELINAAFLGIDRDFSQARRNLVASISDLDKDAGADLIATDSRGQARTYFNFQEQQEGPYQFVDLVYRNSTTQQDEFIKLDQSSWIAAADIYNEYTESIVAGGVRGGLQLFRNLSKGSGGEGGAQLVIKIYPNPLQTVSGISINTNQDVTMELYSLLGQQMLQPFEVKKFATTQLDIGHLRNGSYILRSESSLGNASSQLLMIVK